MELRLADFDTAVPNIEPDGQLFCSGRGERKIERFGIVELEEVKFQQVFDRINVDVFHNLLRCRGHRGV